MGDVPIPSSDFIGQYNDALRRLRAVERLLVDEGGFDPLQTFENGRPLGDTRFLNFGPGVKATLTGDGYVEVIGEAGGDGGWDATVEEAATTDIEKRIWGGTTGITDALAYLNTLGLTRALVLVRPGTYVEAAGTTNPPDNVVLFGAADSATETTTWDPKLHSFSGTVNITAYNMGFRAPGTVGAGPTWNSLTAMGSKFETAASGQARTWATYVRADNCLFESFCTMGGLVQITNSEVFFNVAQTVTLAQQLVMRNVRFTGSSSCTLTVGSDIADLDVFCVSAGQLGASGFPSLTVSCGSGSTLVCTNAAQDDQAGISVTAAAGHNGVYLKGVYTNGTIGAGTEFSHLNARFRGFLDVTGPATLQVILRTLGDVHFIRGRNVGGTIAFTDATISSGTLLSIFSDGAVLSCATDGIGVSGTARPIAFDAGATDNFILFPNIDAWPVAVAGLGATNRVETTPSPYATIAGHVIEDEGTPLTQRANLNFVGGGVTATDSAPDTVVTIDGPSFSMHARSDRTAGDLTLNSTTWANVDTGLDLVLAAVTGDWVEVGISAATTNGLTALGLDAVSLVAGAPVNNWSKGAAEGATELGVQAWVSFNGFFGTPGGSIIRQLVAGDLSGGNVTIRLRYRTSAAVAKVMTANANQPLTFWARNLGQT